MIELETKPTFIFYHNQVCKIHSTTDANLDGLYVVVKGIAQNFGYGQAILIIQRLDDELFYNGFSCLTLTTSCVTPILE